MLSAMARRVVEITVAYPGGPPLIGIPEVAKGPVSTGCAGYPPTEIHALRVPLLVPARRVSTPSSHPRQRCVFNRFEIPSPRAASDQDRWNEDHAGDQEE